MKYFSMKLHSLSCHSGRNIFLSARFCYAFNFWLSRLSKGKFYTSVKTSNITAVYFNFYVFQQQAQGQGTKLCTSLFSQILNTDFARYSCSFIFYTRKINLSCWQKFVILHHGPSVMQQSFYNLVHQQRCFPLTRTHSSNQRFDACWP